MTTCQPGTETMPMYGQKLNSWVGTGVGRPHQKGGSHRLPKMQNWAIGTIPLFRFSSVQTELGEVSPACAGTSRGSNQTFRPVCVYGHWFQFGYFLLAWDYLGRGSWWAVVQRRKECRSIWLTVTLETSQSIPGGSREGKGLEENINK